MQIIPLYKYTRPGGGTTVSPIKPECAYEEIFRLIADDDKMLSNGDSVTCCIDVSDTEGWVEIDPSEEDDEERNVIAEQTTLEIIAILSGEVSV